MIALYVLLLLAGVACFAVSAVSNTVRRVDLLSLGLALVFLVPLLKYLLKLA